MQLTATGNFIAKTIGQNLKSNIGFQFTFKTLGNLARSSEFTFLTFERRSVGADIDAKGRWLKFDSGEGFRMIAGSNGVADVGA